MFLRFFTRFYIVKKTIMSCSKKYLINLCILPIVSEVKGDKYFPEYNLNIIDAVQSDAFCNGIIDHFLKPNNYMLNVTDIAVALNIGIHGYENNSFKEDMLIDTAYFLAKNLKERFIMDKNMNYFLSEFGKDISKFDIETSRVDIKTIFSENKLLFEKYFKTFILDRYNEKISIYYPENGKSHIERKNFIEISVYKNDLPRGFFLIGFDYKSDKSGWLRLAKRNNGKEYFNPADNRSGKIVWQQ